MKRQEKEADREGPRRPITLESIEIADGRLTIADHAGADGYRLPQQIDDLDLKASFAYAPVHYSVVIDRLSLKSSAPQLALTELAGKLAVREDNLYVEQMSIRTAESSLTIDGVVEQYLKTPVLKVTTTGSVSLPEIGRVFPAAAEYGLHPKFDVKASGPADNLALDLAVQSEAGNVRGQVTTDVKAPDFAARGTVQVERLNLAPIIKNPSQRERHHRHGGHRPAAGERSGVAAVRRSDQRWLQVSGAGGHGCGLSGTERPGDRQLRRWPDHARRRRGGVRRHRARRRDSSRCPRRAARSPSICAAAPTASICGTCRRG